MVRVKFVAATALCCALSAVAARPAAAERHTLVIGSGEVTGYYFPTAGALCRVIN